MSGIQLFVYGSLRRTFGRNRILDLDTEGAWLGAGRVEGMLYDLGSYPGAVPGGGRWIRGDVYRIPETLLPQLDDYEDVRGREDDVYRRERVRVDRDGEALDCWVYWLNHLPPEKALIEGGDYLNYLLSTPAGKGRLAIKGDEF